MHHQKSGRSRSFIGYLVAIAVLLWPIGGTAGSGEDNLCHQSVLHLGKGVERIQWLLPGIFGSNFQGVVIYHDGRSRTVEGNWRGLCDLREDQASNNRNNWLSADELGVAPKLLGRQPDDNIDDTLGTAQPGPIDDSFVWAFLSNRTTVYDYAPTGRAYHLTRLAAYMNRGERFRYIDLPRNRVFMSRRTGTFVVGRKDRRPVEFGFALIEGHVKHGPALAVYGYHGGRLRLLARTPWHGDKSGWLTLIRAHDMDLDGCPEIAIIRDPQLNGTLEIWELRHMASSNGTPFTLTKRAQAAGFANHVFGTASTGIALMTDVDGDLFSELVVPDQSRKILRVMSLKDGPLKEVRRIELPSPAAHDLTFFAPFGDKGVFTIAVPLEDNTIRLVPVDMEKAPFRRQQVRCEAAYRPN